MDGIAINLSTSLILMHLRLCCNTIRCLPLPLPPLRRFPYNSAWKAMALVSVICQHLLWKLLDGSDLALLFKVARKGG